MKSKVKYIVLGLCYLLIIFDIYYIANKGITSYVLRNLCIALGIGGALQLNMIQPKIKVKRNNNTSKVTRLLYLVLVIIAIAVIGFEIFELSQ